MRNLARTLAFSTVLLLAAACPKKTGEAPGPADAASPSPAGATEAAREALADAGSLPSHGPDAGPADAGGAVDGGAVDGGVRTGGTAARTDGGTGAALEGAGKAGAGGSAAAVEKCVDGWLAERKLNRFGDPEDTMYAGGTPLFDERTGQRRDRLEYVMKKHPVLRDTCGAPPARRDAR